MKYNYLILIIPLFLISCGNGNDKSDAYGNFEATEVLVGAEVQGKILQLNIEEGQLLKSGTIVGFIDSISNYLKKEQLVAQVQISEARFSQIKAQVDVQEEQKKSLIREQERISKLVSSSAAPTKQLDDINSQLDILNSQILSTKTQNQSIAAELKVLVYQIAQVQDQLLKSSIINPIEGTVLEKYIETGEIAIPGKTLYKIANLTTLKLRVYISGSQLPNVKIGQKVAVFIDKNESDDTQLEGTISWISQQAEFTPKIIQTKEERVNMVYALKVDVKNDGHLKIGMPGEVKF
jgi:HlyD family secretion protein